MRVKGAKKRVAIALAAALVVSGIGIRPGIWFHGRRMGRFGTGTCRPHDRGVENKISGCSENII